MLHKNNKMKIKCCPWFISLLSNTSKFSPNRSPFYTSDTLCLFLDHDQTLMLFLAPSKKKTLTKTSLMSVTWSACNVHQFCLSNSMQGLRLASVASLQWFFFKRTASMPLSHMAKHFLNVRQESSVGVFLGSSCSRFSSSFMSIAILFIITRRVSMQLSLGYSGRIRCS